VCSICAEQVVSDGWDPQRRTVFGEHFNYELLGFQHKCTVCKSSVSKGKNVATSRCGLFQHRCMVVDKGDEV